MRKNQPQKTEKKRPGRKPGVKITHGAYSLIATGGLPDHRRYLRRYLTEAREGLIADLGPDEAALSTAQRILIDRVIGKLGVLRLIEEWAREKGIMQDAKLASPLQDNYLSWANSIRLDLMALGIKTRVGQGEPLDLGRYIEQADAAKAKAQDKGDGENGQPRGPQSEGGGPGEGEQT